MKREQRTIQVWRVLWTYKESLKGSDGCLGISEMSKTELMGITDRRQGMTSKVM